MDAKINHFKAISMDSALAGMVSQSDYDTQLCVESQSALVN